MKYFIDQKILSNIITTLCLLFSFWCSILYAQTSTNCSNNSDCNTTAGSTSKICNFLTKDSSNQASIGTQGACVDRCPDTPCPNEKPVCDFRLGGICVENCTSDTYSCPKASSNINNLQCDETSGLCVPSVISCDSDSDCEDNFVCDKVVVKDDNILDNKAFGYCKPKCTDDSSCKYSSTNPFRSPLKKICNTNFGGVCAPDCRDGSYKCPDSHYCAVKTGACVASSTCQKSSDCGDNMVCNVITKDTSNKAIINRGGVCEPRCPETDCPSGRPVCDLRLGGVCVEDCSKDSYSCPSSSDGTSLTCKTDATSGQGLCEPDLKECTLDTDCQATEVCDRLSITSEHKFTLNAKGVCVTKCDEQNTCLFTNNTLERSPEKPICDLDIGNLCVPDCNLKKYTCPDCKQCNEDSGRCFGFRDDAVLVIIIKGKNVNNNDLGRLENNLRTKLQSILTPANRVFVKTSEVSEYMPDYSGDSDGDDAKNLILYVLKQEEVTDEEIDKVKNTINSVKGSISLTTGGTIRLEEDVIDL